MKQHLIVVLLSSVMLWQAAYAQTDSTPAKPQVKLSVNYNTRLHFFGRTDSLQSSGFFPLAELWLTPEFYINAAPVFVNNNLQQFDYAGTVATAGYQKVSTHWIAGAYLTKPFYRESAALVQSALKAQTGVNLTWRNPVLNLTAGGDVKLSDRTDYGATAGVDHVIRIENNDKSVVIIDPSFYAYAGTQNFQRTYLKKNNGFLLFPGSSQSVTENVSRFNILAYEASVPVIYARGKMMLIATPTYILPQNLVTVQGRPDLSERGENLFSATLTAKYSF